jgi:hypothetical protein
MHFMRVAVEAWGVCSFGGSMAKFVISTKYQVS